MGSNFVRVKRPQLRTRKNVIIAFEGYKTEPKYFDVIAKSRWLRNSELKLVPLWRDLSKINEANPTEVMKYLKENQEWIESKDGSCPLDLFLTKYLHKISRVFPDLKTVLYPHQEQSGSRLRLEFHDFETCKQNLSAILKIRNLVSADGKIVIPEVLDVLNTFMEGVYPDYDFINEVRPYSFRKPCDFGENHYVMVVDRDQRSFSLDNVREVTSGCTDNGYMLILTTPYFELWLAMHLANYEKDEMLQYIREEVELIYEKKTKRSTINRDLGALAYMKILMPEYEKNNSFNWVTLDHINRALARSKELCTDLSLLTKELRSDDLSTVGTNMGDLFALLIE